MSRKYSTKAICVIILGILILVAVLQSTSGKNEGANGQEQAAPAMEANPRQARVDRDQFEAIAAILRQSATGRHFLGLKEVYLLEIQYETGLGSRFRQTENLIVLDSNLDAYKAALIFAHEMHHARVYHEGTKADLNSEARQTYIDLKLKEEVEGMVASIQVKMELEMAGLPVAEIKLPLENHYRQAFQIASDQARRADPALSASLLESIGQNAGENALYEAFASGEVKTSNTFEPYPDYYGRDWDRAHPFQAFIADVFGG